MAEQPSASKPPIKKSRSSRRPAPPKPLKIHDGPPSPKKKEEPKGKGKKVVVASPEHTADDVAEAESAAERLVRDILDVKTGEPSKRMPQMGTAGAKLATKRKTPSSGVKQMQEASGGRKSDASTAVAQTEGSIAVDASDEEVHPPQGYVAAALQPTEQARYDKFFAKRKFSPAIYVDLQHLKSELNLDLHEFLQQYEPFIGNHLSYSPSAVRTFYCNLKAIEVRAKEGEEVEHMLETTVRGVRFELSSKEINKWLGIEEPPADGFVERSVKEVLAVLSPDGDPKGLHFKPSSMSQEKRILWYIYTRCIVSKGNNFTSFTRRDYALFASFVARDTRNLGVMIMKELHLWIENAIGSSSLPFPQLVSLFLKRNKIWYLDPSDEIVRVPRFGRTQLSKMGLTVDTAYGEGEVKVRRKRSRPEPMDEVQSTRGATPDRPPSIEEIVNNAVRNALETILSSHLHMMEKNTRQLEGLFNLIDAGNTAVMELLRTQIEKTQDLSDKLQRCQDLLLGPQPSPQPSPAASQPAQPAQPNSSPPIEAVPHPFTHDIPPKLPSPPISSDHASPSHNSASSSGDADHIIDQVVSDIGQQKGEGKSDEK